MTTSLEVTTKILGPLILSAALAASPSTPASNPATQTLSLRGHPQLVRLYGTRASHALPIVVSSGDGGWIHLAPQVAETLSARGFFVVGFDVRGYLESFTSGTTTLSVAAVPEDYRTLAAFAAGDSGARPILIGVSEGAGLSVLAATDAGTKASLAGVMAIGLPTVNELGWRWWDSVIYVTHGVPNEPTFRTAAIIGDVSPLPLAVIQSTHDEFVSLADVQNLLQAAHEPKRLWTIGATDHRFSDSLANLDRTLVEAIDWIREHHPR